MIKLKSMQDELREEGREEGREEERLRGLNTLIVTLKQLGHDDSEILVALEKRYGDFFTKDELVKMIKQTK